MGSVFKRGRRWYIHFKDENGKWRQRSVADTKREAKEVLAEVQALINKGSSQALTLSEWAETWLERRKKTYPRSYVTIESTLRLHVVPYFGTRSLSTITKPQVMRWIEGLSEKYAPRTVIAIHSVARKLLSDAVYDEHIESNPFRMSRGRLPIAIDKDPEWRAGAVFSRSEVQELITHPHIPYRRRVLYTLFFLTGVRLGEAAGLKWRHWDYGAAPLTRLIVAHSFASRTKTNRTREIPVHPILKDVLSQWGATGWEAHYGRPPTPDDLIIPRHNKPEEYLHRTICWRWLQRDLKKLGMRKRRVHDTRRTFITLARVDGARSDVLKHITHSAKGDIIDLYSSLPWALLCEAVAKLRIVTSQAELAISASSPDGDLLQNLLDPPPKASQPPEIPAKNPLLRQTATK